MVRIKYFILLACAIILCSCGESSEEKARITAQDFLNAYLSTDFSKAASFCTNGLQDKLIESTDELNNLSDQLKDHIKNTASNYKSYVESLEMKGKDTSIITYTISLTDSLQNNSIRSSMLLIRDNKKDWKINKLGTF